MVPYKGYYYLKKVHWQNMRGQRRLPRKQFPKLRIRIQEKGRDLSP